MDEERFSGKIRDLLGSRMGKVVTATTTDTVGDIVSTMKKQSISQLPVLANGKCVGLISEIDMLSALLEGRAKNDSKVGPASLESTPKHFHLFMT